MLGACFIPVGHRAYAKARAYLTLEVFDYANQVTEEFLAYEEADGGIYIPRDYARKLGLQPDQVSYGFEIQPYPEWNEVKLRDEQVPFVDSIEYLARSVYDEDNHPCVDIRAEAGTGKGKTVMALEVCRRLQTTTLVIVDQEFLRDQWIERATDLFGVPADDIGIVQGKKHDWQDKSIVVGMIQSLYDRDMPREFYEYFGFVIFDESHTAGAKQFSRTLLRFPASIRLGVSATSERGDELDSVLEASLGPVQVLLNSSHSKSTVRYVTYSGNTYSWYANTSPKSGRYVSEISTDGLRNGLIVKVILELYTLGHHVLAISDRVEQCEDVANLLSLAGISDGEIGVVTGFTTQYRLVKNDNPKRKPYGYVRGTEYTPVMMERTQKRTKTKELADAKDNSRIVLATYGKFEKGVDVPHLSAGIDMTPRSKAQQVHGRILREHKGKLNPVWVTIRDVRSYRAEHQFANRLAEYVKSNAEVYEWMIGKEPELREANLVAAEARQNAQRLKSGKIVTKCDGNYTVLIQATERKQSSPRVLPTGRTTRSARTR